MKLEKLYNIILLKSRNLDLYKYCNVKDTLQNKIFLFLIHFSFFFNKLKEANLKYNQKIFDYIFLKIEIDLREIGYGDMSVNKKMKKIINNFYFFLIKFDNFNLQKKKYKIKILRTLLTFNHKVKNYNKLIRYFNKYAKKIDLISPNDIYNANF